MLILTFLSLGIRLHADFMVHWSYSNISSLKTLIFCSDLCYQIGPVIGGLLARPAERFPDLFGENVFLKKYPYFLPCAVPATFSLVASSYRHSFFISSLNLHRKLSQSLPDSTAIIDL